jgi:hypothetical protein
MGGRDFSSVMSRQKGLISARSTVVPDDRSGEPQHFDQAGVAALGAQGGFSEACYDRIGAPDSPCTRN